MGCQVFFYSGAYDAELKRELNIDQLFSVYHEKRLIIDTVKYKREHPEYTAKIMCDSGAFTHYQVMKKKGHILTDKDIYDYTDQYLEFLNEWGDDLFCFVGVDSVPDPTNVDPTYAQKTWDNYLYMYERLKPSIRHKLIPVFHYGEDFKWLRNFLEYTHEDGSHLDYIGLAISLEGTRKVRIQWGQDCMKIIAESSNPNVKTHAFGVGVKSVLENIDVYSTDATSWVKRSAYGMISINDKTVYISDVQEEKLVGNHYSERSMAFSEAVEKTIIDRGFRIKPEVCQYMITDNSCVFNTSEGKLTAILNGVELECGGIRYKLVEQPVELEGKDKFCGTWSNKRKILTFDGNGSVIYDNGLCLATNPYARARFNIIDTELWMKDLRNHKVAAVSSKIDLW